MQPGMGQHGRQTGQLPPGAGPPPHRPPFRGDADSGTKGRTSSSEEVWDESAASRTRPGERRRTPTASRTSDPPTMPSRLQTFPSSATSTKPAQAVVSIPDRPGTKGRTSSSEEVWDESAASRTRPGERRRTPTMPSRLQTFPSSATSTKPAQAVVSIPDTSQDLRRRGRVQGVDGSCTSGGVRRRVHGPAERAISCA
jgi:hypothetical protein